VQRPEEEDNRLKKDFEAIVGAGSGPKNRVCHKSPANHT